MVLTKKTKRRPKTGAAKNYITRTQAVRRLQISLADFRRLCIFKGIYPREPRNKKKVAKGATPSTTFYYTRDIQFLFHEPLLQKFREHKSLAKKIGRALGKNEVGNAVRLKNNASRLTLDHLVKERYPTFVDALRDLDDALSMLFLFANLPVTAQVPANTIAKCQRLCLEFQHYLIVSRSLRKSFLSIKGIYYQATIQGQDILWLVPYKFVQKSADGVDFRIMGTFIEFYSTLLGFVNFRLYTGVGLVYPPVFSSASDEKGGELGAYTLRGTAIESAQPNGALTNGSSDDMDVAAPAEVQAAADKVAELQVEEDSEGQEQQNEIISEEALDTFKPVAKEADDLLQPTFTGRETANLFSDFTFFLSRETPKTSLEFILKAFGSTQVGWPEVLGDGAFTNDETDSRITHQIVDRPPTAAVEVDDDSDDEDHGRPAVPTRVAGRTYVQPQWVWDCINQGKLLRPDLYGPGAALPPHLSPWVKPKQGTYDPTKSLEEQEEEGEAEIFDEQMAEDEGQAIAVGNVSDQDEEASASASEESSEEADEDDEEDSEVEAGEGMQVDVDSASEDDEEPIANQNEWDGLSDEGSEISDDEEDEATRHQRELEAELAGKPLSVEPAKKSNEARKRKQRKDKAQEEELARQRMMMSNKKRKLFDSIRRKNKKVDAESEKLRLKRRKLEKAGKAAR